MKTIPFDIRYLNDPNVTFVTNNGYLIHDLMIIKDRKSTKYPLVGIINKAVFSYYSWWSLKGKNHLFPTFNLKIIINEDNTI